MGKRVSKTIHESLSALKSLRRKQTSLQKEKRIYALICVKENRFGTRQELAKSPGHAHQKSGEMAGAIRQAWHRRSSKDQAQNERIKNHHCPDPRRSPPKRERR